MSWCFPSVCSTSGEHRYEKVGSVPDPGARQEDQEVSDGSNRVPDLSADVIGETSGSLGVKHGSSPMGPPSFPGSSVVPHTLPGVDSEES